MASLDVFANEEDRQAHLDAAYAKLIRSKPELLTLSIERPDLLAAINRLPTNSSAPLVVS